MFFFLQGMDGAPGFAGIDGFPGLMGRPGPQGPAGIGGCNGSRVGVHCLQLKLLDIGINLSPPFCCGSLKSNFSFFIFNNN